MKNLIIVESPTKAKTISKFLNNKEFCVESSFGHVRDLPVKKMGIDIKHNFIPEYVVSKDKTKIISHLKKSLENTDSIILATDEDREGEAIAWHLIKALCLDAQKHENTGNTKTREIKRIVFHEITEEAIQEALKNPKQINLKLVNAQQTRRILDRLVGYELSPFLWKTVAKGLSAGRVQSAAVRLIVEKEQEIRKFDKQEYWTIEALLDTNLNNNSTKSVIQIVKNTDNEKESRVMNQESINQRINTLKLQTNTQLVAKLYSQDNKILDKFSIKGEEKAEEIVKNLENKKFIVEKIEKKAIKRFPLPPFTTSTLQQTANRRLGYSAKQTMFLAQQLYEGIELKDQGSQGLITYMRTDSVFLSDKFLGEARDYIVKNLGKNYLPDNAVKYKTKSKGAQEAHEAVRPTHTAFEPESIKQYLNDKQYKLYKLIWQRAMASQLNPALIDAITVDIKANNYIFRAMGKIIKFNGFMKIYPETSKEIILPELKQSQELALQELRSTQRFTKPPARFSEATLIKKLEELGIGRPSTYAPIISTIQARHYVVKDDRYLKPTEMGEIVNKILVKHFPKIVDYNFTAKMEDELDEIASGERQWVPVIKEFYEPFKNLLEQKKIEVSKKDLEEKTDEICDKCSKSMTTKIGRFGKFLACSGFPECKNTKPINNNANNNDKNENNNEPPEDLGVCPECGKSLTRRRSKYGEFIGCSGYPNCRYIKKEQQSEKTGVTCPKCNKGELISKRTRRGKIFYACSTYPDCDQAYWNKPTGKKCPTCSSLITETPKGLVKCSNKECETNKKPKKS